MRLPCRQLKNKAAPGACRHGNSSLAGPKVLVVGEALCRCEKTTNGSIVTPLENGTRGEGWGWVRLSASVIPTPLLAPLISTMTLPCWPPELTEAQRKELTNLATTYALAKGLGYLPLPQPNQPPDGPSSAIHGPFTLLPSPFPRNLFTRAQRLQRTYNVLYARIARDVAFLDRVMGAVGEVDEFTGTLWRGWKAIRDQQQVRVDWGLTLSLRGIA